MLTFDPRGQANDPGLEQALRRLKALVADLEAVRSGRSGTVLPETAPLLDQWDLAQRTAICLVGRSNGHPLLPGMGRQIATSELWLMSADRRWARTSSRWYRLGEPRGDGPSVPQWHQ